MLSAYSFSILVLALSLLTSYAFSLKLLSLQGRKEQHLSDLSSLLVTPKSSSTALNNHVIALTDISPLANNIACTSLAAAAALLWLQVWISFAKRGKIEPKLSRKIIHTGSAPLYLALFPLFSDDSYANIFAASVPLSQLLRLVSSYYSSNNSENAGLVNAISRTGNKREALEGPFYYNVILFLVSLFAFRTIPGVFVIGQMAAGDGMADIVGRRFGSVKWPFSKSKSIAGSLGFVAGAFVVTCGLLVLYTATGCLSIDIGEVFPQVLLVSVICALVELLPIGE